MLNNKSTIRAWTFYDWANSAYSLIITSAFFPAYYTAIAPDTVSIFDLNISKGALASYSIALSFLVIAILSPILSAIADTRGNKKSFMKFFCYLGAASCMLLAFFDKSMGANYVWYGILFSIIASIGYCGSIVFYNAFLPEIASKDEQDRVSAKGFAMGYIGSVLLMIACFIFILLNEKFQWFSDDIPVKTSFVAVGLWWIGFAQIPFKVLKEEVPEDVNHTSIWKGYQELQLVFRSLTHTPQLKRFLASFFFYNMGVQTVMYMATYFASDELKMKTPELMTTILIIQVVAILGARLFAYLSHRWGNKSALLLLVIIWIGICYAAYFVKLATEFYAIAFAVGMVMGGIQSLSRSTYSKLLPSTHDTASYFSFYDVCDKMGIVIGTLSFGLVSDLAGGMRNSTLALSLYFIIGLMLLLRLKKVVT